jgi:hypothetical protein
MVLQSGATLFDSILSRVFANRLVDFVPQRVLPISEAAPISSDEMMETEVARIKGLMVEDFERERSREHAPERSPFSTWPSANILASPRTGNSGLRSWSWEGTDRRRCSQEPLHFATVLMEGVYR